MKIGLIDVDGHNFPNIPLMKISSWHKKHGDFVEMIIYITLMQTKLLKAAAVIVLTMWMKLKCTINQKILSCRTK